jgi:transketolase
LSLVEILAALYGHILRISTPEDPERDRFVLSKGHAALALYAALHLRNWLSEEDLKTYCADRSRLGVHPDRSIPGVDFTTGSLGHGLSMGAGAALAARLQGSSRRVFVLVSDGECNEGALWETIMFAGHHRLANLIAIVDLNEQQAFGYTHDVLDLKPMTQKWTAFGWEAVEVDGHSQREMIESISSFDARSGPPHVMVARTTFGKGISFMERLIKWHYWPMSDEEYAQAIRELDA